MQPLTFRSCWAGLRSHRAAHPAGSGTALGGKGSMESAAKDSSNGVVTSSPTKTVLRIQAIFFHLANAQRLSQCLRAFRERKGLSFRKVGLAVFTLRAK